MPCTYYLYPSWWVWIVLARDFVCSRPRPQAHVERHGAHLLSLPSLGEMIGTTTRGRVAPLERRA